MLPLEITQVLLGAAIAGLSWAYKKLGDQDKMLVRHETKLEGHGAEIVEIKEEIRQIKDLIVRNQERLEDQLERRDEKLNESFMQLIELVKPELRRE